MKPASPPTDTSASGAEHQSDDGPQAVNRTQTVFTDLLAGLTVSFVAISLGAAFGIASGRKDGAFVGILSAGIIALLTSLLGGTRIQCSGPTAPMTAVTAGIVVAVTNGSAASSLQRLGIDPHLFVNQVILLTAILLLLMGALRLGNLISRVPHVVISGFMNGIALLIWVAEISKVFGLLGRERIGGQLAYNVVTVVVTTALCFLAVPLIRRFLPRWLHFLPGALVAIVVVSSLVGVLGIHEQQMQFIELAKVSSLSDVTRLFSNQAPTNWTLSALLLALPYAANLAFLCYLDTLLTALAVDRLASDLFKRPEVTNKGKELAAQGVANAVVAFFGGLPGAQATIRSVLILNERATTRVAGVAVGLFVVVEMLLFQGWLEHIPKAVFTGVLLKVGYDVMDWGPILAWVKSVRGRQDGQRVSHAQIAMILGVAGVTVFVNLNVAVLGFTALFYLLAKTRHGVPDLSVGGEFQDDSAPAE